MRRTLTTLLALVAALALAVPAAAGPGKPGDQTIAEIAAGDPGNFSTLLLALELTGLDAVVASDDVTLTVFAPTNAAFDKAAAELGFASALDLAVYLLENDLLDDVLLYHVVDGRRFSNSVVNRNNTKSIETLLGPSVTSTPMGKIVDASGATSDAAIVIPNINASNGVIHVIDNVLVPLG